jgi:hypothetical protein
MPAARLNTAIDFTKYFLSRKYCLAARRWIISRHELFEKFPGKWGVDINLG